MPRGDEVSAYLEQHPDLVDTVVALGTCMRQEFGEDAELSLELYRDPEIDDLYLTLYVRKAVYEKDVIDRIDRIASVFADALNSTSGWLIATTDFHPPGSSHGV